MLATASGARLGLTRSGALLPGKAASSIDQFDRERNQATLKLNESA